MLDRGEGLVKDLRAGSPNDAALQQQHAELLLARSSWRLVSETQSLKLAYDAFGMGLGFLRDQADDPRLRGTAFRCFEHLVELLFAGGDVDATLAAADAYRDANPYKWQSQVTLARTYLQCRELLTGDAAEARRQLCLGEAQRAVLRAGQHSLKAVLTIETDEVFAPLLTDSDVQRLLASARAAASDG
jgi:hypothetical protein